jgi:hypothetical protein
MKIFYVFSSSARKLRLDETNNIIFKTFKRLKQRLGLDPECW